MGPEAHHSSTPLIDVRQLVKTYPTPAGAFTALDGMNVQIQQGEFVAVIGKSGSGKSTFINMLTSIDRPTSGEVLIGGVPVHSLNESQMAEWRGRTLGIVFQFFQLLPTLTLVENIMLPMEINGLIGNHKQRRERAMHLLDQVGMAEQANKLPAAVSGGQQQRVAIARALANDPPLIVADEPTGNLDSKTAESIFALFHDLVAAGKTILMVTHDNDQAQRVNRTLLIADGQIVNEHLVQALSILTQDQLVEIKRKITPHEYAAGALIVRQGDLADKFYIITEGEAEVYLQPARGGEVLVNTLQPGQYFGEMALLGGGTRTATIRASEAGSVSAVGIDSDSFNDLISDSRSLREELTRILEKRRIEDWLQTLAALDSRAAFVQALNLPSRTLAPGEVLARQGDPAETFFIILEGSINPQGGSGTTQHLPAGSYFEDQVLMGSPRRAATYQAGAEGAQVAELNVSNLERLVDTAHNQRTGELKAITREQAQQAKGQL